MGFPEPLSNKHLSNAFRSAATEAGLALYSTLMTVGAAIQDAPVLIVAPAGGLAAFFSVKAMGSFAKGLDKPAIDPIEAEPDSDKLKP